MSDRFDFLEFGDEKPVAEATAEPGYGWRPLRLRAVEVIGEPGTKAGQFNLPTGLAVDSWGSLYVADSGNHRVQRITPGGDVYPFGKAGQTAGELWGPQSVAVAPDGKHFFVAEQGNQRVQGFHFLGQSTGVVGGLRNPSGVTFDAQGALWIADTGNGRVLRFDTGRRQFIGEIGAASGVKRPIAVYGDAAHGVWITDSAISNVSRHNYGGMRAGGLGDNRRLHDPAQIAIDKAGRIYLAETGKDRLHVFAPNGDSLLTYETPGSRSGPLKAPAGVALGPNGEIYLADTGNHRVLLLAWE